MLKNRKVVLIVCLILALGSISAVVAYALRLSSVGYRRGVELELSERLGMTVSIESIRSLSGDEQILEGIRVALPDTKLEKGEEVFSCASVLWSEWVSSGVAGRGRLSSPGGQGDSELFTLSLRDGWLVVGTSQWERAEYEQLLAGGLGHDFSALGLGEIRLDRIDLKFRHPVAEFAAGQTSGVVWFDESGGGHAALECRSLNGVDVPEPVSIALRFTPGTQLIFHEVKLSVPPLPLDSLGLERLLDHPISRGEFGGTIAYRQSELGESVSVAGSLRGAALSELTAGLRSGPYSGTVDVDLESVEFTNRQLTRLVGDGQVSGLRLGELIPDLIDRESDNALDLQIDQVRWQDGRIEKLSTHGGVAGLSLEAISNALKRGRITGRVSVKVASLQIVDDKIISADVQVVAEAPRGEPGVIDRDLLSWVGKEWLGVDLSMALPSHIEYEKLGLRFVVRDGRLHVLGTHGVDNKTILTVRLFGHPIELVSQPKRDYPVPDIVGLIRERAVRVDRQRVRSWWEQVRDGEEEMP